MSNRPRGYVPITLPIARFVKISIFMKRLSKESMMIWNMDEDGLWNSKKAICMKAVTMFSEA